MTCSSYVNFNILHPPVFGMLSLCCNFTWILWWYIKCGLSSVLEFCILQIPPLCSLHKLEKSSWILIYVHNVSSVEIRIMTHQNRPCGQLCFYLISLKSSYTRPVGLWKSVLFLKYSCVRSPPFSSFSFFLSIDRGCRGRDRMVVGHLLNAMQNFPNEYYERYHASYR